MISRMLFGKSLNSVRLYVMLDLTLGGYKRLKEVVCVS